MRKYAIVSLSIALLLLIASCSSSGGGNPTATPGTFLGPQDTETAPVTTIPQPIVAETPAPPVISLGTPGSTGIPATGGKLPDYYHLSALMGFAVSDDQGNSLGTVNDMIVSVSTAKIEYVVVGSGGFLGIGQKDLVVPFSLFLLDVKNPKKTLIYQSDTALLKNNPGIDLTTVDLNATDWDQSIGTFWSQALGSESATPGASGTPSLKPAATKPAPAKKAKATATKIPGSRPVKNFLASKLLGARVSGMAAVPLGTGTVSAKTTIPLARTQTAVGTNPAKPAAGLGPGVQGTGLPFTGLTGEDFGGVEDAIIDPTTGQVQYVVLAASTALNIGDKIIPVPLRNLVIVSEGNQSAPENVVVVVPDIGRLRNAPNFDRANPPDVTIQGWDANIRGYWYPSR